MKKIVKYLFMAIGFFLLSVVAYILISLALSYKSTNPEVYDCPQESTIYLSTNGVHLDIILPVEQLDERLIQQLKVPNNIPFVAFGWGDQGFFINTPTWADLTIGTTVHALFWKSKTAMHVSLYCRSYTSWQSVTLCPEQVLKLNTFIKQSFKKTAAYDFIEIEGAGYSTSDFFYEANGSYSFFKTCNVWANQALKKADLKTAIYSPFDFGILYHFKE